MKKLIDWVKKNKVVAIIIGVVIILAVLGVLKYRNGDNGDVTPIPEPNEVKLVAPAPAE